MLGGGLSASTANMEIGLRHALVGKNLYVASDITKMGIGEVTMAVLTWLSTAPGFLLPATVVSEISCGCHGSLASFSWIGIHGASQVQE